MNDEISTGTQLCIRMIIVTCEMIFHQIVVSNQFTPKRHYNWMLNKGVQANKSFSMHACSLALSLPTWEVYEKNRSLW